MIKYIFKRLISVAVTLLVLSVLIFAIIHLTPGDPARIILGADASDEAVSSLRSELGLDVPLPMQYFRWVGNVLHGDFGRSYSRNGLVLDEIFLSMGPTLILAVWGQAFAIVFAVPMGIIAARHKGKWQDSSVVGISLLGISIPSFLLSLLLVIVFSVGLSLLPSSGYKPPGSTDLLTHLRYIVLPVISLSMMQTAMLARMTRASMIDVIGKDYIKTAKSKGIRSGAIMYKHALKNAMIPVLTTVGQSFATLISGAAVVETVFNIPGIGQLIVNSVTKRDYPMIQGIVLTVSLMYIVINLLVDMLYGAIDPRVRVEKG
jgi:peptide/nickel transport system permease protein